MLHNVVLGAVPSSNPFWLQVDRSGYTWTFRYSTNGTGFTTVGGASFNSVLVVSQVGLLAGSGTLRLAR